MTVSRHMQPGLQASRIQRSFAGVCVALLLVGGLISMPTTCDCGAGVPHGHSLFILQGHHHGPDGAVFGATDAEHHGHHQHNYHDEYSPATGPQLDGRITHNADRVVLTMPQLDEDAGTWQRIRYADSERTLRGGRVDAPEPPPPRIYPAS